jgi:hypothetical protein
MAYQPGREFGRISGPLLSDNLLRNGNDLAFETQLVYLSVNGGFVGFNNSTPVRTLDINSNTVTDNLIVDTETLIDNSFDITTNQIVNYLNQPIVISPNQTSNPTISITGSLNTSLLSFGTNTLTVSPNTVLYLNPYASANKVTNSSFNSGLTGWTLTGPALSNYSFSTYDANDNAIVLTSYIQTSNLSQTLTTTQGQTQTVTFTLANVIDTYLTTDDGVNVITTENSKIITLENASLTAVPGEVDFAIYWNGVKVTNITPVTGTGPTMSYSTPASASWTYSTYTVNLMGTGSDVLQFAFRNDRGMFYLANVSVTQQGVSNGITQINSNTLVNGTVHATGNITFDGSIVLGDSSSDRIFIAAEVDSNIIPSATNTYNLGSSGLEWLNLNVNSASISSTLIATNLSSSIIPIVNAGNITITGTTISDSNNDLALTPTGTGSVKFNGISLFTGNQINNTASSLSYLTIENGAVIFTLENTNLLQIENPSNDPLIIANTGSGVTQFAGTGAVQVPSGTNSNYPASTVTGQTRWNISLGYTEIYNGSVWQDISGLDYNTATAQQVNDLNTIWSLILG